jgi:hypothetical protein
MKLNPPNKRKLWKLSALLLTFAVGITVLCLCFLPQIKARVWHLRYGNQISFQDWTLPVPRGWHAHVFENGLSIDRERRPFVDEITTFISVGKIKLSARQPFDSQKWKRLLIVEESKQGYKFSSEEALEAGADVAYCYHFDRSEDPKTVLFLCHLSPSHIFIDFEGSPRHLSDAYEIIRGTRGNVLQLHSESGGAWWHFCSCFELVLGSSAPLSQTLDPQLIFRGRFRV